MKFSKNIKQYLKSGSIVSVFVKRKHKPIKGEVKSVNKNVLTIKLDSSEQPEVFFAWQDIRSIISQGG